MGHVIAGCGAGISQDCARYAAAGWTGGGILLGVIILVIIVVAVAFARHKRG